MLINYNDSPNVKLYLRDVLKEINYRLLIANLIKTENILKLRGLILYIDKTDTLQIGLRSNLMVCSLNTYINGSLIHIKDTNSKIDCSSFRIIH